MFEVGSSCLEKRSTHWFKYIYIELRSFSIFYKNFLDVLKVVACKICFKYQFDFPFNVYIGMANTDSK